MTVEQQAKQEARQVGIQEVRYVTRKQTVMCRLSNGVCGFGKDQDEAVHEAYARAARAIVRAINTSRISRLSSSQMAELDKALRR